MHDLVVALGVEKWKPWLAPLILPPVPFLVLIIVGARLMFRRRMAAWLLIALGVACLWLSATPAATWALTQWLLQPPPALSSQQIAELKRAPKTAIVVLGGGRRELAPEYGMSTPTWRTAERLRYGLWLARETGLPVAFTGGVGHGSKPGVSEAETAARVAEREYGRPLRWTESESRDTRENALKTVPLLKAQGIETLVLVTHANHMPRALRNFERATQGTAMRLVAAPMAVQGHVRLQASDWMPNGDSAAETWVVLHEWLGRVLGA